MVLTLSTHRRRDATRHGAALPRLAAVLAGHALLLGLLQLGPPGQEQRTPVFVSLVTPPQPEPLAATPVAPPPSVQAAPAKPRPAPPTKPASPALAVIDELAPVASAVEFPAPELLLPSNTASVSPATSAAPSAPPASVAAARPAAAVIAPRFDAAYLDNPRPEYPRIARRMGEHGKVTLRVFVSAAGVPEKVEIGASSGSSRLDQAARDAVRQWKFVPARQGDQPVAAWVLVPITFMLEG
jgi:protein TonB